MLAERHHDDDELCAKKTSGSLKNGINKMYILNIYEDH